MNWANRWMHLHWGDDQLRKAELMRHRQSGGPASRSSFAGYRFPADVIVLAVRWYLRYGLMPLTCWMWIRPLGLQPIACRGRWSVGSDAPCRLWVGFSYSVLLAVVRP